MFGNLVRLGSLGHSRAVLGGIHVLLLLIANSDIVGGSFLHLEKLLFELSSFLGFGLDPTSSRNG